ncbi:MULTISPECIES: Stk1 family PASTA domain-containing Ser/Thr kinase [Bifidobacterium]|uniref:non-specific serine/threonine protein kinase n=2 Tax=Bifidobacterium TaxID=1678 RepID=A0A2M9HNU6_9BIFI|nr:MULTISPECIES: Stk1 family PASTA domain-containing Ser/Thr kinase [Bifidobacterium]NMM98908.1 serine/threonine protein kinase [Bifidobacterium sp. DSM 109959]PJM78480.1 serine/threonine protein kinase [Bifidobacterium scaligerum]
MSTSMPTALAGGRYQLGQLIGRGGMAEVHVALDTRLGRTVAVKIMRADLANDDIFLARFRREAHAVAQMNNPNIVNIYDSGEEAVYGENGETERLPYIVMEYVKGQTLRDILKVNGALSQRDSEQVMLGVLNALDYSHRMGIIHRDIKPGNIMISEQGVVKVMDFGIARALDDSAATMTQSQGVVGTAQYLSPEQARGETVDMRSDLYSAGCVLYEMLTGRPPFTGDSAVAIAYQHVSEVATPPSAVVPGLPKMWDSICAKAMAKDRQNRYATAAEFKTDILTYMNGGVPVAAAFNPLTDLSNVKARKEAERDQPTVPMTPGSGQPTQAFNPATGQFEQIAPNAANAEALRSRAQQRAQAAKAKKRKKIIIASIAAAVVVALIVVGAIFALKPGSNQSTAETVTIPECTTSTSKDGIQAKLEALGLTMVAKQDTDSTEPEGTCTKMSPKAGSKVEKGSKVQVWFSAGPQSTQIPDVTKRSQDEARSMLEDAGFKVSANVKTEDSDSVAKDMVTRTDPVAGQNATKGSTITLWVSTGMTKVPSNLVGQPKDSVLAQYSSFNFVVESETSDTVPEGSITRVDPGEGSSIEQGGTITIWVSTGKEQATVPSVATDGSVDVVTAKLMLQAAGFNVNVSGPTSNAVVVGMNPAAGSQVDAGSTVTITTKATTTTPNTNTETNSDTNKSDGDATKQQ